MRAEDCAPSKTGPARANKGTKTGLRGNRCLTRGGAPRALSKGPCIGMGFTLMVITRDTAGEYGGTQRRVGEGGVHKMSIPGKAQGPGEVDKGRARQEERRES